MYRARWSSTRDFMPMAPVMMPSMGTVVTRSTQNSALRGVVGTGACEDGGDQVHREEIKMRPACRWGNPKQGPTANSYDKSLQAMKAFPAQPLTACS